MQNNNKKPKTNIQIGKEEIELSLFSSDMIFSYVENPRESTKKRSANMSSAGYKNQPHVDIPAMNYLRNEITVFQH
jgi:hypothetical protein